MEKQEITEKIKQLCTDGKLSQQQIADLLGTSRTWINLVLNEKKPMSKKMQFELEKIIMQYDEDYKPEILFDYCRIRFPTDDVKHVVEDLLKIKIHRMIHFDYGFYDYNEMYVLGDIFILTSPKKNMGVLLELKGKGCRQFEMYLKAQERTWYNFLGSCISEGAMMKRIDLAINDKTGVLDIPYFIDKSEKGEFDSNFKKFETQGSWNTGEVKERAKIEKCMGQTLYCGSKKSDIYFCLYQKDYEQYLKYDIDLQDTDVKNRFELRLSNTRAQLAVENILVNENPLNTAFGIINRYLRFIVPDSSVKAKKDLETDPKWQKFTDQNVPDVKLTVKPERYTFDRTMRWFAKQVAPMWKTAQKIDEINETNYIQTILDNTKLKDYHKKLIVQQTTETEDILNS